jgi:hypothetical protein
MRDTRDPTRTLRDETIVAEYVATEETMENVGSVLDTLVKLGELQQQYWRAFWSDQRETFNALTNLRSAADVWRVGFEHWSRRATHVADGIAQTAIVLANERRTLSDTFVEMWSPFVELVRRDWRRR